MSTENLRNLERDVEAARAKLTGDLSMLRSPETYSEFADSLKQAALDTKNSLVDDARVRTQSAVDEFIDKLKSKAAANPAAVLLIGAGIAWHLMRRPPIVAALLGGGLYGLLRTQPDRSHLDDGQYLDEAKARLRQQARDAARSAGDAGMQAADLARQKASELAHSATEAGRQAADLARQKGAELTQSAVETGRNTADLARQKAAELAQSAKDAGRQAADAIRSSAADWTSGSGEAEDRPRLGASPMHAADLNRQGYPYGALERRETGVSNGGRPMDTILLGAAGVAVAAAVALAYRRGSDEHPSPDNL